MGSVSYRLQTIPSPTDVENSWFGKEQTCVRFGSALLSLQAKRSSSSVIETLDNEHSTNPQPAPVSYFYCVRNEAELERADPDEILRCILKQLCSSKSDQPIREPVVKEFKTRKESEDDGCELTRLTLEETVELIL